MPRTLRNNLLKVKKVLNHAELGIYELFQKLVQGNGMHKGDVKKLLKTVYIAIQLRPCL